MRPLNFKAYPFRLKNDGIRLSIFDPIRKRFMILTPEEWVRQHVVQFLLREKNYPASLVNVEKILSIKGLAKRYDIVVFNPGGSINILVECKAPEIKISQGVFDQIARYNMVMRSDFLMVTNGLQHFFCRMDYEQEKYIFLESLPDYRLQKISP